MARWRWGALLLLLAGCAGAADAPMAARCEAGAPVVLPLREVRGRPLVQVAIGGQPAWLAVDTGSGRGSLTPDAIARLGLARDARRPSMVSGTGGLSVTDGVVVESLEFGERRLARPRFDVHPMPGARDAQPPIDGLIGVDLLSRYDVEFDLPAGRLVLHEVRAGCTSAEPAWTDRTPLPLPVRRGWMVLLEARVDGRPVRAMLASGTNIIGMTEAAARRIGITTAMLEAAPRSEARGADGNPRPSRRLRIERIGLGPESLLGVTISVSAMALPSGVEMLLGLVPSGGSGCSSPTRPAAPGSRDRRAEPGRLRGASARRRQKETLDAKDGARGARRRGDGLGAGAGCRRAAGTGLAGAPGRAAGAGADRSAL
jgi:predicted aspartyl protease